MADNSSLLAAFESSGIKATDVVVEEQPVEQQLELPNTEGGINIPPIEKVLAEENKVVEEEQQVEATEEEIDYIKSFAEELGYDGEIEGDDFDTLLKIAKTQLDKQKEEFSFYETNEQIKALASHLKAGGTLDSYLAEPQEVNVFSEIQFEEDDVDGREEILTYYYKETTKLSDKQIKGIIETHKTDGEFNTVADQVLEALKQNEQTTNQQIVADREARQATAIENHKKFVDEVKSGFEKGLPGITADKSIIEKAKSLSLPDASGQFGIHNVKLTPVQEAAINVFITAMTDGKPFQYNPTKGTQPVVNKPINKILSRSVNSGGASTKTVTGQGTIGALNDIFRRDN